MQLRFRVNQAEAFRQGISVPKSIVRVEVEPADLKPDIRSKIADRMDGIDVCVGSYDTEHKRVVPTYADSGKKIEGGYPSSEPFLIEAKADTLEALIEAVELDDATVQSRKKTPRPAPLL